MHPCAPPAPGSHRHRRPSCAAPSSAHPSAPFRWDVRACRAGGGTHTPLKGGCVYPTSSPMGVEGVRIRKVNMQSSEIEKTNNHSNNRNLFLVYSINSAEGEKTNSHLFCALSGKNSAVGGGGGATDARGRRGAGRWSTAAPRWFDGKTERKSTQSGRNNVHYGKYWCEEYQRVSAIHAPCGCAFLPFGRHSGTKADNSRRFRMVCLRFRDTKALEERGTAIFRRDPVVLLRSRPVALLPRHLVSPDPSASDAPYSPKFRRSGAMLRVMATHPGERWLGACAGFWRAFVVVRVQGEKLQRGMTHDSRQ